MTVARVGNACCRVRRGAAAWRRPDEERTRSHHQQPRLVVRPVVGRGHGAAVTRDLLRQRGRKPGRTGTGRTAEDDGGRGTGERALPGVAQRLQLHVATDHRAVVAKLGGIVTRRRASWRVGSWARIRACSSRRPGPGSTPSSSARTSRTRSNAAERLGLLAAAVVGEHQQLPQPLAQRLLADAPLELGHDRALAPERQLRLRPRLDDRQPQLIEPASLGPAEDGVLAAGVRLPRQRSRASRLASTAASGRPPASAWPASSASRANLPASVSEGEIASW